MSRVLVFGGGGFIGRHVCDALGQHPEVSEVRAPGREVCDLVSTEPDDLADLLRDVRPEVVVNCTGRLSGTGYDLVRANAMVTGKLIDAIARHSPAVRLVRLGSAAEYGVVEFQHAVHEDDAALPVSEYGVSHLAGTQLVTLASAAGDVDGVVLRVFNPIGPGLHPDNMLGRAVALIRDAQRDGGEHVEMGPLSSWRDFVDVRDVATAVCAAAFAQLSDHRVFNVGRGRAIRCRQAMELLAGVAGFHGEVREAAAGPARSATVDWMLADVSRAADTLKWMPRHELADSVNGVWAGMDER